MGAAHLGDSELDEQDEGGEAKVAGCLTRQHAEQSYREGVSKEDGGAAAVAQRAVAPKEEEGRLHPEDDDAVRVSSQGHGDATCADEEAKGRC